MHFAVQLLSPPVSDNWGGNSNGLLAHAPMLYAALQGMNNADAVNVFSLFGMVLLKVLVHSHVLKISTGACLNLHSITHPIPLWLATIQSFSLLSILTHCLSEIK